MELVLIFCVLDRMPPRTGVHSPDYSVNKFSYLALNVTASCLR